MSAVTLLDPVPLPLPGEPEIVGAKARDLSTTASALRTAIAELRQLASDDVTISEAVDEIRVKADGVRENVVKVEERYSGAATAMFSYKTNLTSAHNRADAARQRVVDNNTDASYWRRRLNTLTLQAQSGDSSQELLDDILEAKSRVASFALEFGRAMAEYNGAEADRVAAVDAAIQALHDAAESSGLNDNVFDYIALGAEVAYEWAQENLTPILEAIREIAEIIKSIVDILSLIVSILAIFLPILAPLASALLLASLALSLIIFMSSLLLFALGKETLGRVLGDLINVVASVVTAKLGGAFKPGALSGMSALGSSAQWASQASSVSMRFTANVAAVGAAETVSHMAMQVVTETFGETVLTAGEAVIQNVVTDGLDINMDFFPEGGNGGMWGPFEGGWDLTQGELAEGILTPVADVLTGGFASPVIELVEHINPSLAGS